MSWWGLFLIFIFWLSLAACGILFPRPGTEPGLWQWKRTVLTIGPLELSKFGFIIFIFCNLLKSLFIYMSSFVSAGFFFALWAFSSGASGSYSSLGFTVFHCSGFFCCGAQALGFVGFSSRSSWALESRLSSCGIWTYLLPCGSLWDLPEWGMWDLPWPGIKPVSPALAGGFLTTRPQGKPWVYYI